MMGINELTKSLLRDKLMKEKRMRTSEKEQKTSQKRSVSPLAQRSKRRIIEDSVEQVLRDTIFQLSVNKLQFSRWKLHEPPLSRTVLIWNMVRVIDKEIQQEKVVDDVLSILGDESNVKFIKVCRTDQSAPNSPTPPSSEQDLDEDDEDDEILEEHHHHDKDVEMVSEPVKIVSSGLVTSTNEWTTNTDSAAVAV